MHCIIDILLRSKSYLATCYVTHVRKCFVWANMCDAYNYLCYYLVERKKPTTLVSNIIGHPVDKTGVGNSV